jgi:hypothetical protein
MSIEMMVLAIFAAALLLLPLIKVVANVLLLGLTIMEDNQLSIDPWPPGGAGIVMMAPSALGYGISRDSSSAAVCVDSVRQQK